MKTVALVVIPAVLACAGCAHQMHAADSSPRVVCRDGTSMSENNECGGHGGVSQHATSDKTRSLRATQAAGAAAAAGGKPDEVWAMPAAKTYACRGDADYGKSREGQYMSEQDARSKGMHPAAGSTCGS